MKELRCIVFNDRELLAAVVDRRRRLKEAFPDGEVKALRFNLETGVQTFVEFKDGSEYLLPEDEVQAALIAYCMQKNIPLPADAEKTLYVIRGHATLMITMNFRKPARLVAVARDVIDR